MALSVFTLGDEKHQATTEHDYQAGDNFKGCAAGVGGEENLRPPNEDEQQARQQPWSTSEEGHRSPQMLGRRMSSG